MSACFLSPVAYITMIVYIAVSGSTFLIGIIKNTGSNESLSLLFYSAITLWLTVLITVICMRLFAEERRSGTLETLMTAPITEMEIVMGKYFGALSFLIIAIIPTISFVYILRWYSNNSLILDNGAIIGGAIFVLMFSAFASSLGLLISMLTRSQIVSAISIFCVIWCSMLFGNIVTALPEWLFIGGSDLYSIMSHLDSFARGLVDTRTIIFYLASTVFLLFVAIQLLESRRLR